MATNDETRAAERIIAMTPSSWDDHPETMISIARVIARAYLAQGDELARLRAANTELAGALRKELNELISRNRCSSHWLGCESSHPICAAIERIRAALARHDAGKGNEA